MATVQPGAPLLPVQENVSSGAKSVLITSPGVKPAKLKLVCAATLVAMVMTEAKNAYKKDFMVCLFRFVSY